MTLLRGHFAWMLIAEVTAPIADLAAALSHLESDGLTVSVMAVHDDPAVAAGSAHLLTVHGADRPGIVAAVTAIVAKHAGNITDLSTRLGGKGMYVLIAEVDLPQSADVTGIREQLADVARDLGVGVSLRPAESDVL